MPRLTTVILTSVLALTAPVRAQQSEADQIESLRKEIAALRESVKAQQTLQETQGAILKELQEIKVLLAQRPGQAAAQPALPVEVVLSVDNDHVKGAPNAKLTLIEFSDFQCPFCGRHFRDTLKQIEAEYIKTGKVRYAFRDFPLESIHPQAFKAAEAANCAAEQGKFWEMHDRLFANQQMLGLAELPKHASAVGLDSTRFSQCLNTSKPAAKIRKDLADGERVGVNGTPSFFIGLTDPGSSEIKSLRRLTGAQPYAAFKEAIESLLAR